VRTTQSWCQQTLLDRDSFLQKCHVPLLLQALLLLLLQYLHNITSAFDDESAARE
jgi:hypothetical protein